MTGKYATTEHLEAGDFRLSNPRFQCENLRKNASLLAIVQTISDKHSCTPAQTALSWLLRRYEHLAAIPGTRSISRVEENCRAASITLSEDDIALLDTAFAPEAVHGERYTPEGMKGANA